MSVCKEPGCITVLSTYNPGDRCFVHDGPDIYSPAPRTWGPPVYDLCNTCGRVINRNYGNCRSCIARSYRDEVSA